MMPDFMTFLTGAGVWFLLGVVIGIRSDAKEIRALMARIDALERKAQEAQR